MKPFLVLQLRPETDTSDNEYAAILDKGGLMADEVVRLIQRKRKSEADLERRIVGAHVMPPMTVALLHAAGVHRLVPREGQPVPGSGL